MCQCGMVLTVYQFLDPYGVSIDRVSLAHMG
jgi:hypothetical protein